MSAKGTGAAGRVRVFYVLLFMATGVSLPFVPGYFATLGLSGTQIGVLLAVAPLFAVLAPPLWGQLADQTGQHGRVLTVLCVGAAVGYALLSQSHEFGWVLLALAFQSAFGSSITTIIDSIALHQVQGTTRTYASLRSWGSIGFVVSTLVFGAVIKRIDHLAVLVPMAMLGVAGLWAALTLGGRTVGHEGPKADAAAVLTLLRLPGVGWFLLACGLHWVACAPYHGSLTLHLTSLGLPPWVVSVSSAVAVGSEVLVMSTWSRGWSRIGSTRLLVLAFAVSAVRWLIIAATSHAAVLVAASLLHGLTFGVFYLAAVAFMAERAPGSLRATGQAMFVAATFGVGGLFGYIGGGRLFDALGGHGLFAVAGVVELLPVAAILLAARAGTANSQS